MSTLQQPLNPSTSAFFQTVNLRFQDIVIIFITSALYNLLFHIFPPFILLTLTRQLVANVVVIIIIF